MCLHRTFSKIAPAAQIVALSESEIPRLEELWEAASKIAVRIGAFVLSSCIIDFQLRCNMSLIDFTRNWDGMGTILQRSSHSCLTSRAIWLTAYCSFIDCRRFKYFTCSILRLVVTHGLYYIFIRWMNKILPYNSASPLIGYLYKNNQLSYLVLKSRYEIYLKSTMWCISLGSFKSSWKWSAV